MSIIVQIDCDSWKKWHEEEGWVVFFEDLLSSIVAHFKVISSLELSVVLTDDVQIKELNATFRNKPNPTNVLSFPQTSLQEIVFTDEEKSILLGDIVMSYSTVYKEAQDQSKLFIHHVTHLFIHGVLHLLGFDHANNDEAEEMEALEVKFLSTKNISNPYQ